MKKSKGMIIILIVCFIVGIALFLISGIMSGWDIVGWLKSPTAILFYFLFIIFGLCIGFILFKNK